ncbi:MAG TPA: TetR family transcriptional regulator [Candidatus Caenarcaniphilales bacterium]
MSLSQSSTRQRLIKAALELFTRQGVTETTTRQIAELAEVNEVTLFRHFGHKQGLLLAVLEEAAALTHWSQSLIREANHASSLHQTLKDYASNCLQALEKAPEFVRSVVGESGQYPPENRQALGRDLMQANSYIAEYLAAAIDRGQLQTRLPAEKLVSLLNGMLLGYVVIEFTSEFHELWDDRDDFLDNLVELFINGAVSQTESLPRAVSLASIDANSEVAVAGNVADLPANLVHATIQKAKKLSLQDYALAYVLFGAGLSPDEISVLQRSHHQCNHHQHLLQVAQGLIRQVPVNRWIMGKRYGSYTRNPLTQWLKSRKDSHPALFLDETGEPISIREIGSRWQLWTTGLLTPEGQQPTIEQAHQTWCVELLIRGISLEDLSLLTGQKPARLQAYACRASEKLALEQVMRLDQPNLTKSAK